ncbi:MAG: hypothetical protein WDZ63_12570 [Burkholderiales bacterium]
MKRRSFILSLAVLLSPAALAHTPYRQWKVMRERYLMILSSRTDPESDVLAERLAAILQQVLPEANAIVSRAPQEERVASLLTTGQVRLAVMSRESAQALYTGTETFGDYEGKQLRVMLEFDRHLLVTVEDFPRHHAWLVTSALVEHAGELPVTVPDTAGEQADGGIPAHSGSLGFGRGESLEEQE